MKKKEEHSAETILSRYEPVEYESFGGYDRAYTADDCIHMMQTYADQFKNVWVSVEDMLPENSKEVFVCYKGYKDRPYRCIAQYTDGYDLEVDDEDGYDEERFNYKENDEQAYMPKGLYECPEQLGGAHDWVYIKRDVTHWQPLPSPPKTTEI